MKKDGAKRVVHTEMEVTSDPLLDRSYRFLVEIVVVLFYRLVITPRKLES